MTMEQYSKYHGMPVRQYVGVKNENLKIRKKLVFLKKELWNQPKG